MASQSVALPAVGSGEIIDGSIVDADISSTTVVGRLIAATSSTALSTTWFVNSSTGSNSNAGTSSGTALATLAELERRLRGAVFTDNMTVTLDGTFTEDVVVSWTAINGKSVAIVGTPTSILTGTFTAKTDINAPSAIAATVTDSAIPTSWTASGCVDHTASRGSYLIRKMSGANTVAAAFTMKDLTAKECRVSSWVALTQDPFESTATQLETTVSVSDAYRVDSLTQVGDIIVTVPGTNVICQWLDIRAQGSTPLKFANAGTARITLRMTSVGSDSLVEGSACINWYCACFQIGSSGIMVGEANGFGLLLRYSSAASGTFRIFGAGGVGFPGSTCLQSCGIYMENGTAIGVTNILACDLTAAVPAVELATNSRVKFSAITGISCAGLGLKTGAGSIAVLSSGIGGTFTAGASSICGAIVPNAKLGVASFDLTHLSGVVLENGVGTVKIYGFVSTTAARPTVGISAGTHGFDTTLGKPVWYTGAAWVDATGAVV